MANTYLSNESGNCVCETKVAANSAEGNQQQPSAPAASDESSRRPNNDMGTDESRQILVPVDMRKMFVIQWNDSAGRLKERTVFAENKQAALLQCDRALSRVVYPK